MFSVDFFFFFFSQTLSKGYRGEWCDEPYDYDDEDSDEEEYDYPVYDDLEEEDDEPDIASVSESVFSNPDKETYRAEAGEDVTFDCVVKRTGSGDNVDTVNTYFFFKCETKMRK